MTVKIDGTNTVANPAFTGADTDTGLQCGTDELKLVTGGTARVTVDSSGRLGIASESPDAELHVGGSEPHIDVGPDSGNRGKIGYKSNDLFFGTSSGSGEFIFKNNCTSTDNPADSGTERLRILSDGTIRLASNSPGIDFSQIQTNASNMTSETLDSYEEGTWTPLILGVSGNGTWTAASNNGGFYVKIGKQVTAWFNAVGSLSGATGHTMRLHGLPFTSSSNHSPSGSGNAVYSAGSMQYWSGAGAQVIGPLVEPNTTIAYFHTYASGSTSGAQVPIQNTNHNLHAFITYFVA